MSCKKSNANLFIVIALIAVATAAGKEASWIEIRTSHFRVFSDAGERRARTTAAHFEQFRALIQHVFPKLRVDSGNPLVILAVRDEDGLKALLPQYWETKGMTRPAGIFVAGPEKRYVALRTDASGEDPFHVVYHEYVHMLMRFNFRELPLWLSEGFAEFFGHASLSDNESGMGRPSGQQLELLRQSRLLPLEVLLKADQDSPHYREADKSTIFYAQSWALTHYLMIGDKGANYPRLQTFLGLIQKETPHMQAAGRAFGDLKQLEKVLDDYIRQMSFYFWKVPVKLGIDAKQFPAREVERAEMLAVQGDFHVHMQRYQEAKAALDQALMLNPQNAAVHESLGFYFMRQNDPATAARHFVESVKLNSGSFLAHFYAAQAAWEDGAESHAKEIEEHLRKAIEINPEFAPAHLNLSIIVSQDQTRLEEALVLARKAAVLEPGNLLTHLQVGRVLLRMERLDEASSLADRILAAANSAADRSSAESLLRSLKESKRLELENKRLLQEEAERRQVYEEARKVREAEIRESEKEKRVNPPAEAAKPTPAQRGRSDMISMEGRIITVACSDRAVMILTLESGSRRYTFRAANFFSIRYWSIGGPGGGDFKPCDQLKGSRVEVEFTPSSDAEYQGELQGVGIYPK